MRLGILGGSFNPVHYGHLLLAQDAYELCGLTRVLFVPCAQPPHKSPALLVAAVHRRAMLAAALADDPRFELCDLELTRGGTSYTIDTVRALATLYPQAELVFLIGTDMLAELASWKDVSTLLTACRFVTCARPGYTPSETVVAGKTVPVQVLAGHQVDISSSDIRRRAARGLSLRYLVPDKVARYIHEHGLYQAHAHLQQETCTSGT